MIDGITVRSAEKSDIPQLVDLMNSQYARKKDEDYFLWQYFDSYYPAISMCAFDNSRLIGIFGMQKRELENGIRVGHAIDSLVASDWRKKGIITLLGKETFKYFQDLDLLFALNNQHWKIACEKAFGWQTVSKIDSVILHKNSFASMKELAAVDNTFKKKKELAKFKYDTQTRIWRFDQSPEYKYTYIKSTSGGYAITKIFIDPLNAVRYGDIVAFKCDINNRKLLRDLFLKACKYLIEERVESITTWALPHTPLRKVVESLGFIDMPQERYFCMKILNQKYDYLYDISNWHLIQADAEIY